MSQTRRSALAGGALLLALGVVACKRDRDAGQSESSASGAASATSETESLFSGAPGSDVELTRLVDLRQHGVFLRVPVGWGGDEDHVDGLVSLSPVDQSAVVMVYLIKAQVTDATIALWTKSARGSDVDYGPVQTGTVGKDGLKGQMANGMGKLAGKDAEFWRFVVPLGGEANMLVIAAVQKEAQLHRRAELIACLRSLWSDSTPRRAQ